MKLAHLLSMAVGVALLVSAIQPAHADSSGDLAVAVSTFAGVTLVAVPCSPSYTWTFPKGSGLTYAEEENYAFSHPSEALVTPCKHATDLSIIVDRRSGGVWPDSTAFTQRSQSAVTAYRAALDRGVDTLSALKAAEVAFDSSASLSANETPASDLATHPMSCYPGTNAFTYNYDTLVSGSLVVEWEFWYNTSGAGCTHIFQQTKYQFVMGSPAWFLGSRISTGQYIGTLSCTNGTGSGCQSYRNIPVTLSWGNQFNTAWPMSVDTLYCRYVNSGGICSQTQWHYSDNIPT